MSNLDKKIQTPDKSDSVIQRIGAVIRAVIQWIGAFGNKIFLHPAFLAVIFAFACAITIFEWEYIGAVIFVLIISAALFLCEDIFAAALPFLLLCVFVTRCYDSYNVFIKYVWVAVPAVASIIYHFIAYRKKISLGTSVPGIIAVSVALILGGIGFIPAADYFRPGTLYYTLCLGIGMLAAYVLLKPQICAPRKYDVREKFLMMMYLMGLMAAVVVFAYVAKSFAEVIETHGFNLFKDLDEIIEANDFSRLQAGNNLSTFLMFALPCPFYFAAKKRLKVLHLLSVLTLVLAIVLSGSRGGFIMGLIEFVICLVVFAIVDKKLRWVYIVFCLLLLGVGFFYGEKLYETISSTKTQDIFNKNEPRVEMLFNLLDVFKEHKIFIFGHGIGFTGNTDFYNPVKGAMHWYHMIIPQIVGSMGIVGVLAYLYQFFLRCFTLVVGFVRSDKFMTCALGLSYLGVLMMSMLNPGLFCPIPYALLAVLIFALIDGDTMFGAFKKQL